MKRFHSIFCSVFILSIAFIIIPSHADNAVPVLLWGGSVNSDLATSAVNPFLKTSSKEFDLFLRKKLKNSPPVLLYVKDNLCIEDLVKHKQHLQKVTGQSLHYFPAVEKAVNTIEDLPSYNQTYNDYVDSVSDRQLLIVPISNLDVVPETFKTIKDSSPNLIAVLTGKSCSYRRSERVKRESVGNDTDPFIVSSNRVLLYSRHALSLKLEEKNSTHILTLPLKPTVTDEAGAKKAANNLVLVFSGNDESVLKHKLVFMFEVKSAGYYTLKRVNYTKYTNANAGSTEQSLITNTDISFPFDFSYHCSQNVTFKDSTTALHIVDFQVQLDPKLIGNNSTKVFSDAYDCVGFTTIPIWTGIFVTAILALIMIWGLSMIIDIRTMDRFDDPKGKTITISASE